MKRMRIIVETREVLLIHDERLEGRCPQCGAQIEIVTLPAPAARHDPGVNREAPVPAPLSAAGRRRRFVRLKSLLKWF